MLLNLDKFTEGFEHIYGEEKTPTRQSLNEEYSLYINDEKIDVFDCLADLPDDFWDDEDEVEVWNEDNGKQAGYKAPYGEYEDYEPIRRPAGFIQESFNYDAAIKYLENRGIDCDPCSGIAGEYACDLLDDAFGEYEEVSEERLENIANMVVDYMEEETEGIDESCTPIQECGDVPPEKQPKPNRLGTPEYAANEGRRKREAMYRKYANIDEDFEITEENIKPWAFRRTCTMNNCQEDRLRAELLRKPFTGYERYDED